MTHTISIQDLFFSNRAGIPDPPEQLHIDLFGTARVLVLKCTSLYSVFLHGNRYIYWKVLV